MCASVGVCGSACARADVSSVLAADMNELRSMEKGNRSPKGGKRSKWESVKNDNNMPLPTHLYVSADSSDQGIAAADEDKEQQRQTQAPVVLPAWRQVWAGGLGNTRMREWVFWAPDTDAGAAH